MTEPELRAILKAIDAAVEIYRKNEGSLSVREISMKSMLMAVRTQISDQLVRERSPAKN